MKVVRVAVGSLLVVALVVAIAYAVARRHTDSTAAAGVAPRAGRAVPAAAPPVAPIPTLPPHIPAPPPLRPTGPDLTTGRPPQGLPAIRPRLPLTDPGRPTFAEDDARAYITRQGIGPGRVRANGAYQIERIEFLRGADTPTRLGVRAGVAGDQLLCAATLRGTFTLAGPPTDSTQEYTKSTLILIFDAHTGNLLGQDALP